MDATIELLDLTMHSPEENLALDEALLEHAERNDGPQVLRFWESDKHFVVLGAGGKVAEEVDVEKCERDGIKILRRCSGGGTVLQGPGCLNFQVVLHCTSHLELRTIESTNRYILQRTVAALSEVKLFVDQRGTSDLALDDRKISGTAQRRKKKFVLFHGTLLYAFDLGLVSRYLTEPVKRPEYRQARAHSAFVRNLPLSNVARLKDLITHTWGTTSILEKPPLELMQKLVSEKYSQSDWNRRF